LEVLQRFGLLIPRAAKLARIVFWIRMSASGCATNTHANPSKRAKAGENHVIASVNLTSTLNAPCPFFRPLCSNKPEFAPALSDNPHEDAGKNPKN
jgi:hypothetical protein